MVRRRAGTRFEIRAQPSPSSGPYTVGVERDIRTNRAPPPYHSPESTWSFGAPANHESGASEPIGHFDAAFWVEVPFLEQSQGSEKIPS